MLLSKCPALTATISRSTQALILFRERIVEMAKVRAMMRDQADISQDARVMDTMTTDCLDTDTIRRYRQRMDNLRPGHVWSELAVEDFLHRIGAMARDADGKLRPTAAGLLNSHA